MGNMRLQLLSALRIALLASCLMSAASADTGMIQGQVHLTAPADARMAVEKYRGKISGNVAPAPPLLAGVWLEGPELNAPANPTPVSLSQSNYQFGAFLIIVPLGTSVAFPNDDPDYHNIYSLSQAKRFDLGRYKKSETPAPVVIFDKAGFVALHCEIHDHMQAGVIVVNSPHFTTTDAKGHFTLKNIPAGSYTLHAQSDRKTVWQMPVKVQSRQTTQIAFHAK